MGAPEGLNRQPHSEQPKPRKRGCSTHASFRFIAAQDTAPHRCRAACLLSACPQGQSAFLSQQRTEWLQETVTHCWRGQVCTEWAEVYAGPFERSVGHPTYEDKFCSGEGLILGLA